MPQRRIRTPRETFDDPGKQIVHALFEQFVAFFAPVVWADIDWNRPPIFLDKELRRVAKGLRRRRVTADFLVQVWLKSGEDLWLLAHIELQSQRDARLPERMFRYNFRAFDLHGRPVYSLAILADGDFAWRPNEYGYEAWDSRMGLEYPVVKLLDYTNRIAELEASNNPFALAVLAQLRTLETRGDAEARLGWKLRMLRMLVERRRPRAEIEELFQFIDWVMGLPGELEYQLESELQSLEREMSMAQTMAPMLKRAHDRGEKLGETIGEQIGRFAAKREDILQLLEHKFVPLPREIAKRIEQISHIGDLDRLYTSAIRAESLEDIVFPSG